MFVIVNASFSSHSLIDNYSVQMLFLQLTVQQIKAEMEKTLQWLVPIANNTTK